MQIFHDVINNINYVEYWIIQHQQILIRCTINIISASLIMIIGIFSSNFISQLFNQMLSMQSIDTTVTSFLTVITRYVIITMAAIVALNRLGVQTTSVIAILGAAGMAVGLALQGSLSNFAAGVLLIVFSPLRIGEYVVLKNVSGTVLNIHVFYTTLKTLDGKIIVIPNGKITANNIINHSRSPCRKNEFIINVAYDTNIKLIIKILKDVMYNEPRVLKNKDIVVSLSKIEPYSINFIAKCWSNTNILNTVYSDLMIQFKQALDENNISLAYPKFDIYINKKKKKKNKIIKEIKNNKKNKSK
ncbi:mechanosensitive ion channel domain-containing protein [Buchnera aphidicola]|uniref:mechanosensitive ion channel domain-containing protein n=1 Tax=Buchnera aphidicola TaxID=9 RepID=UPI0031B88748